MAAAASRDYLDSLMNALGSPVFVKDGRHVFVFVNDACCAFLGRSREELLGKSDFDFFPKDQAEVFRAKDDAVRRTGQADSNEELITDRMGRTRTILTRKALHTNPRGEKFIVGTITDITERKQAEEALRRSEERFRSLVENTSDWVWEVDERLVYTYASPRVRDLLGYEPGEVLGKTPQELMPEEEARRLAPLLSAIVAEHKPFRALENKNLRRDGREVTLETSGIPFFGPDGRFRGYRGIDRDITERKRTEQALRENQQLVTAIVETSRDWIWAIDLARHHTYSNRAVEKILGYLAGRVPEHGHWSCVHPEDRQVVDAKWPVWVEARQGWENLVDALARQGWQPSLPRKHGGAKSRRARRVARLSRRQSRHHRAQEGPRRRCARLTAARASSWACSRTSFATHSPLSAIASTSSSELHRAGSRHAGRTRSSTGR